jgi:hypothetical protein
MIWISTTKITDPCFSSTDVVLLHYWYQYDFQYLNCVQVHFFYQSMLVQGSGKVTLVSCK